MARKEIDQGFSEGEIGEDDKFRGRKKLDELIKEYNEKVDKMLEQKEEEIME